MAQLVSFGMPEAEIAKAREEALREHGRIDTALPVHPDNRQPLRLLIAMSSQWRTANLSTMTSAQVIRTGLDYTALTQTAELAGLAPIPTEAFLRLQLMEAEALAAWAEARR